MSYDLLVAVQGDLLAGDIDWNRIAQKYNVTYRLIDEAYELLLQDIDLENRFPHYE